MLYDTEFLIAYTTGYKGVGKARAARFLAAHSASGLFISRITWMEFSSGVATRAEADQATSRFSVLEIDDKLAWHAARVRRYLQGQGTPIGDHDVWIAATALAYGLPLVSNNSRHFVPCRDWICGRIKTLPASSRLGGFFMPQGGRTVPVSRLFLNRLSEPALCGSISTRRYYHDV